MCKRGGPKRDQYRGRMNKGGGVYHLSIKNLLSAMSYTHDSGPKMALFNSTSF
jgi:hypothetical protein